VTTTQIQGAADRDLAMISVKDFGYAGFEGADLAKVRAGDTVLTTDPSGTPFPPVPVVTVRDEHVEIDDLRAVIGAPVVLARTGKVIGVVSTPPPTVASGNFSSGTFADRDAAASQPQTAFALRFDNVPNWEIYLWDRFQTQTAFLDDFHRRTQALDSYLNDNEGSKLWKTDDKIKSANASFVQDTVGGDVSQRKEALHALLFELGVVADTDMDQISQPGNFYSYEQKRAHNEMAYRQALKAQLDSYGNDINRFNSVASRNN